MQILPLAIASIGLVLVLMYLYNLRSEVDSEPLMPSETELPHGTFKIEKFHCDEDGNKIGEAYEVLENINAYTNAGGALLLDLLSGAGGTAFNNANAWLGVGDSSTANAPTQTDLVAATNKVRKAMNATFPSRAAQVLSFKADFGSTDANWAWQEQAIFNAGPTGGTMLARAVGYLGTKVAGTIWTLTYTITVP